MLTPEQAQLLIDQRKTAKRALGQGRRWFLRGFLMFVISIVAGYRGGQVNVIIAIVMVLLAALCFSLGRSLRRNARASIAKIDLMEKT
jgi:hypothetical protein